ncbi:MAG: hypothetical protein WDM77_00085 [Steroidobacteraceae bacterium]
MAGRRERYRDQMEELKARRAGIKAALVRLEELTLECKVSEEVLAPVRQLYRERLRHVEYRADTDDSHTELIRDRGTRWS